MNVPLSEGFLMRNIFSICLFLAIATIAGAQDLPQRLYAIRCGRLIDGKSAKVRENVAVIVEGKRIKSVVEAGAIPEKAEVVDLQGMTVLPGLIDCHTHVLLQGDITSADYDNQLLKESIPYRTIRGAVAAQAALRNGFTTIRDLETEGAMYADTDIKRAINNSIIEGPRMFVATRSLDVTGAYPLLGYSWELHMPKGVQVVDGADECRKAVREQVEHGADWIKVYADRSYYFTADSSLHSILTFTFEELKAICDEAHKLHRNVAAHAVGREGIENALRAGATSIEHGDGFDDEMLALAKQKGAFWCPTLFVTEYVAEGRAAEGRPIYGQMIAHQRKAFAKAVKAGVKIATGTDAGGFAWDINEAVEMRRMVDAGMTPMRTIQASTSVAAELLGMQGSLGEISPGAFADIVAVQGDPLKSISVLENVVFVMKEGKIYKSPGSR